MKWRNVSAASGAYPAVRHDRSHQGQQRGAVVHADGGRHLRLPARLELSSPECKEERKSCLFIAALWHWRFLPGGPGGLVCHDSRDQFVILPGAKATKWQDHGAGVGDRGP
jgi:hypothetical protein